jgi:hypothetical protein
MDQQQPLNDVTHKEIYDRLVKVEQKVDKVATDTEGMVKAFNDAQGAFHVLEWLAKIAKPILWIVGVSAAIVALLQDYKQH